MTIPDWLNGLECGCGNYSRSFNKLKGYGWGDGLGNYGYSTAHFNSGCVTSRALFISGIELLLLLSLGVE